MDHTMFGKGVSPLWMKASRRGLRSTVDRRKDDTIGFDLLWRYIGLGRMRLNNYLFAKVGNGLSTSEKIR